MPYFEPYLVPLHKFSATPCLSTAHKSSVMSKSWPLLKRSVAGRYDTSEL